MNDTQGVLTSRRWLVWLIILGFGLAIVGESLAQRRGGWGGGYRSPSYTYRPSPPRPMTPAPRPMTPTPRPTVPTMAPQKGSVSAQVGKTTPGGAGTRALPSKLATAPIAQVPSYTGRITTKGAPIVVTKTGVPYSVPGKGMFSTKTVSTFRMVRTDRVRVFSDGRITTLQSRIAKVAIGEKRTSAPLAAHKSFDKIPPEQAAFAPGSAGAAKVWTAKSRLKDAQLPTTGKIRYVPPDSWSPNAPLPRGPNKGYMDKFGNEWLKGPSRTKGQPFEWDVQLGRDSQPSIKDLAKGKSHLNISLDGKVTH